MTLALVIKYSIPPTHADHFRDMRRRLWTGAQSTSFRSDSVALGWLDVLRIVAMYPLRLDSPV